MNKRQSKKEFRKAVRVFPYGRKSKAGLWLKKQARKDGAEIKKGENMGDNDFEWINKCIVEAEKNNDEEMVNYFYDMLDEMM